MASERFTVGQGFARERRRREIGRKGCDDCGVLAPVVGMYGTAAARERLCPECRMYREIAARRESAYGE